MASATTQSSTTPMLQVGLDFPASPYAALDLVGSPYEAPPTPLHVNVGVPPQLPMALPTSAGRNQR